MAIDKKEASSVNAFSKMVKKTVDKVLNIKQICTKTLRLFALDIL